jgi:hypothetical protein
MTIMLKILDLRIMIFSPYLHKGRTNQHSKDVESKGCQNFRIPLCFREHRNTFSSENQVYWELLKWMLAIDSAIQPKRLNPARLEDREALTVDLDF